MTLLDHYEVAIETGEIDDDSLQREVLQVLQRLATELQQPKSWLPWVRKQPIQGVYIFGPVGAGKTYLVDLFFNHIAEPKKARFHFHHFMQQIDAQLRKHQGEKDPLRSIAKQIVLTARVLCFDEFLVHDVATAMILAELFQALMAEGIILVISSNTAPDNLYQNGVQRKRFLPAIDLIKHRCDIVFLNETRDYRLGRVPLIEAYLTPLNKKNQECMEGQFNQLATDISAQGTIRIQHRDIPYIKRGTKAIWFDFQVLCFFPRSQLDYLELASIFDTVFVSNVPALTENHTAQAIMFVHLIDVLYDRGIKLVLSAAVPAEELYVQGEMKTTFQRTVSRLKEMQSADYMKRHPKRMDSQLA